MVFNINTFTNFGLLLNFFAPLDHKHHFVKYIFIAPEKIFKYLVCCSSQISYAMNGGGIEKVPQKALAESESTLH